jgi:hypothetical protein
MMVNPVEAIAASRVVELSASMPRLPLSGRDRHAKNFTQRIHYHQ